MPRISNRKRFCVMDRDGEQVVEAASLADSVWEAVRVARGRVFSLYPDGKTDAAQFYLVRGTTAYPISARVAALEFAMGEGAA